LSVIKFNRSGVSAERRKIFSSFSGGLPTRRYGIRATKKPRLMARRGGKMVVLLLIFPKLMVLELELAPVIET